MNQLLWTSTYDNKAIKEAMTQGMSLSIKTFPLLLDAFSLLKYQWLDVCTSKLIPKSVIYYVYLK